MFTFVDRFSQFLWYLYVKMGPVSEQEICALNGYPRVQNVFSFDSQFDSPHKVKRNACSLLNASYNVIAKQYIFVLWMKAFPHFWLKQRSQIRPKLKQNKTKQKSLRNSQIYLVVPWCTNKFCYRVIHPLIRCWRSLLLGLGLKCSEGNWPMYSRLKLTLVQ